MPTYYLNPENALNRANEFCELGKDDEALDCLHDVLKNRKGRMMKHIHEMIINKLLELCVEHKRSQMAKDGLYNYRILCQGINIKSWEDSICKYLSLAESKVERAEEDFHSVILVDDLDQGITPEYLLKTVSSENAQDRTERILLLPWIKFLWECYRNSLDLLKNTQSVKLYHIVAKDALKFCVKFSRKNELRKLCNALKMHAIYIQNKPIYFKTDDVETRLICLDTGFTELECAIKMELWQDAFKAIENIHTLMNASKSLQHSKFMAHYYQKISCIFWKGEEYLFHAAANLRYFFIWKEQKKRINSSDFIKLASRLTLSILAVPPDSANPATDLIVETDVAIINRKNKLLTSLLNLSKCPTRANLIKDAVHLNIIQYLPEKLSDLFQTLENNAHVSFPSITAPIDFIKNWLDGELQDYIPLIQKVAIAKILPLLSNFYANIKMTKLLTLTGITQMSDLEIMLVDTARRYEFSLRVDHRNMCVHFPTEFSTFKNEKIWDNSLTIDSRPDTHLGWLIRVHSALKSAAKQIHPELEKNEHKTIEEELVRRYFSEKEFYRKSLLKRKTVIEKYKESLEKSKLEKEEYEKKRIAEKLLQYETAEKERLLRETEERKMQRIRREQDEIKRKLFLEKMEIFKKSVLGSQIVENLELENIDNLDPQILFSKQVEQLNKERKQLTIRLRRQERNFDHFERAKRIEEIPLIIERYEKEKVIDIKVWNEAIKNKIDAAYKKRELEVQKKARVLEIKQDLLIFLESVKKKNLEMHNEEMEQFISTLTKERQKRLKKRAEQRKQKRKEEWLKQQKIKANKEMELKGQSISKNKDNNKQNTVRKIVKNQDVKCVVSPKKTVANVIVDDMVFGEDVSSHKEKISNREFKKDKYKSTETSEKTYFSKDIYYYKRTYKADAVEVEKTELYEKKSSIFSEFPNDLLAKSKHQSQKSDIYNASSQIMRTKVYESSNETSLSWRTPWARKDSYTNQHSRSNKGSEMPQQSITILRRETRSETADMPKDKNISETQNEKIPKSESKKNDARHSCTPWAKLKRQAPEK